ncbi:MAG: hypothetical protein AUH85_05015 [Chloroflexi bacterium 13_1_40CM_4_68_4]|nr:MAG: hypothetical protein AUH85_05015 [Chloroflexi bacterium 13_1_40CM_4_68_4]
MRRRPDEPGDIDWSRFDWNDLIRLRRRTGGPSRRSVGFFIFVLILFLIPVLVGPLISFWTDVLWFRSIGLDSVFLRRYSAAFIAFVVFFFAFFVFAAINVWIATRPRLTPRIVDVGEPRPSSALPYRLGAAVLLVLSLFFGLAAADQWDPLLRALNATAFGISDPVFGQDVGFYFFTLPVLEFLRGWALWALVIVAIAVLVAYAARGAFDVIAAGLENMRTTARSALSLARPVRAHLSVLGALFLMLIAVGYQLDRYGLLFQRQGNVLSGAGYTAVNAQLPALTILTVIAAVSAVLLLANVFARTIWLLVASLGVWLLAAIVVGGVYPALIERFVVQPNQFNQERTYIERHLAATRAAYGLAAATESSFDVKDQPTSEDVTRDLSAVENVRVWDYRPLQTTLAQLQALRQYYEFPDIDVTRIVINGKTQQLMVAARELNPARVPQSWINVHLGFTHSYGAVAVPVSAVTPEGQPALTLKDLPPQGQPEVTVPQIYYGQDTNQYVIVGTTTDEFDYPKENTEQTTRYTGGGGIKVSNVWDKLIFGLRFGDLNMLIAPGLTDSSRLLMHRQIVEREQLIAPFLDYDNDPYLAFMNGKLYWIHDAYTTGTRYPYASAFGDASRPGAEGRTDPDTRYIRNSVKIVTDAYDGSITFYVVDPNDPVVLTLQKIYPELFKCLCEMQPAIRAQLRYPEDLFRIQAAMYGRYHVTDPSVFYTGTDNWQIASEILTQGGPAQQIEPYYVITRLPDATSPEFVLFVPMTPVGRNNMVGWLAGRSDGDHYGELRVLRFATDRTIFGPLQVEARIDQDPDIKTQLALLSQGGTTLFHGNLLVIPVGSSFIYVEPIFIQASAASIPELRRVVLATQTKVVMRNTFPDALAALIQGAPPVVTTPPPTTTPPTNVTPEIQALVKSISDHYAKAQAALRNSDFATYGAELDAMAKDLARLRDLTGVTSP